MTNAAYTILESRAPLAVTGDDSRDFLQGLISNDTGKVAPDRTLYAALLTPQGKYLFDFFIGQTWGQMEDGLILDCEAARLPDLIKRLTMYKLRAKAELADRSADLIVAAVTGDDAAEALGLPTGDPGATAPFGGGIAFVDPRLAAMGARVILPRDGAAACLEAGGLTASEPNDFETRRLELGLADGSRDLVVEKSTLLESGFDELNGVDWNKGCYMGQELTARTKYRGLVKKRLVPVSVDGPLPDPGTPVLRDGREAGELRSGAGGQALALMRIEQLEDGDNPLPFTAGDATVHPRTPAWAVDT